MERSDEFQSMHCSFPSARFPGPRHILFDIQQHDSGIGSVPGQCALYEEAVTVDLFLNSEDSLIKNITSPIRGRGKQFGGPVDSYDGVAADNAEIAEDLAVRTVVRLASYASRRKHSYSFAITS